MQCGGGGGGRALPIPAGAAPALPVRRPGFAPATCQAGALPSPLSSCECPGRCWRPPSGVRWWVEMEQEKEGARRSAALAAVHGQPLPARRWLSVAVTPPNEPPPTRLPTTVNHPTDHLPSPPTPNPFPQVYWIVGFSPTVRFLMFWWGWGGAGEGSARREGAALRVGTARLMTRTCMPLVDRSPPPPPPAIHPPAGAPSS